MYAEYVEPTFNADWELAITFEPEEAELYSAYISGLPEAIWNEQTRQWEVKVRKQSARKQKSKTRTTKTTRPSVLLHQCVL